MDQLQVSRGLSLLISEVALCLRSRYIYRGILLTRNSTLPENTTHRRSVESWGGGLLIYKRGTPAIPHERNTEVRL